MYLRSPKGDREEELAAEGYEHFHGKESEQVLSDDIDWPPPPELTKELGVTLDPLPRHLTALGELTRIEYEDMDSLEDEMIYFEDFKTLPILASDYKSTREGKETLFIVGGDYEVEPYDSLICGPLIWLEYQTVKSFDDFQPTLYKHRFHEPFPMLASNRDGTQLYIFRHESKFSIDRSTPVSGGIDG